MLRFFLITVALSTAKASHLSVGDLHGLHSSHTEPKLISQSVGLHEIPTKIIKITKTVAIKVPVPYPVKVPHHIPVPVPVNRPFAIPVPQIVKVPHHVPIEVSKPVPIELHQQVPLVVSRPVPIPQPVHVPHPVNIDRPVYYPVPHPVPFQQYGSHHGSFSGFNHADDHDSEDSGAHESRAYTYYTVESPHQDHAESFQGKNEKFQPSQPDYTTDH